MPIYNGFSQESEHYQRTFTQVNILPIEVDQENSNEHTTTSPIENHSDIVSNTRIEHIYDVLIDPIPPVNETRCNLNKKTRIVIGVLVIILLVLIVCGVVIFIISQTSKDFLL